MKHTKVLLNAENFKVFRNALQKVTGKQISPLLDVDRAKTLVVAKAKNANAFYKRLTGLDDIEYYQNRVIELQDELTTAQQKRRELQQQVQECRRQAMDVQERLHKVHRHDEPKLFMELMCQEMAHNKRDRDLTQALNEEERNERDVFTAFTNAIRDSQEKQAMRMEYAKYVGFAFTLLGAVASYCIASLRSDDLKHVIRTDVQHIIETTLDKVTEHNADDQTHLAHISQQLQELCTRTTSQNSTPNTTTPSTFTWILSGVVLPVTGTCSLVRWMWRKAKGERETEENGEKSNDNVWWMFSVVVYPVTASYSVMRKSANWMWRNVGGGGS